MSLRRRLALLATLLVLVLTVAVPLQAQESLSDLRAKLDQIISLVEANHKDPVDTEKLYRGAIDGALKELNDPYTSYFNPEEFKEFNNSIEGSFSGIGIYIDQLSKYITVVAPIKGSPAEAAGLRAGDRLLEADDQSLVGVPTDVAAKLIRGPVGTTVTLKVERPGTGKVFEVQVVRADITIPVVESEMLTGNIGYLRLYSFSDDAGSRFGQAVRNLSAVGARGLIIDLRDNPGGYLNAAVDIASYFVPKGETVLQTVGQGGTREVEVSAGHSPVELPTVVLVNKGSASASEIVAGALQDYGVAQLVGETTFGKGTVQSLLTLADGSVLKVTIAEYLTPQGRQVDQTGLAPDVLISADPVSPERTQEINVHQTLLWSHVGLDVLAVQQRLNDLGYRAGPENGYFGGALRIAVEQFQKDHSLSVTGMAEQQTLTALNEAVAEWVTQIRQRDVQKERAVELMQDLISNSGR